MRTTNFDVIAASAPLNREASVVRDGSGDQYEGKAPEYHAHWKAPPLPEDQFRPETGGEDMTGVRFGRMVVVRYHRRHPRLRVAQWLVRCACGDYELRRTRAIKAAQEDHKCQVCDWFTHVQFQRDAERRGRTSAAADAIRLDQLAQGKAA